MPRPFVVGIDLGTTNSTAAVFDGHRLEAVRTQSGSTLLPSVVRVGKDGSITVGDKARRFLSKDPDNTRGGFKRLLGTSTSLTFPASGKQLTPEQLSTEVLRTLIADVVASGWPVPERAVVTVPALFELPQTEATARAARAAGLLDVEMLQEPVASALAGGFRTDGAGAWLVYDLGGGTFDASLVVGEEGMLSVIGHDGDNYLGGRDFDAALAALVADLLAERGAPRIHPKNPAHQRAWRALIAVCEEAKIELSRQPKVDVALDDPLDVDGTSVEVDVSIERSAFEARVQPLVDRSIEVCSRLLAHHGRERLDRIVLVGGPTAMPMVRQRVAEALGPIAAESLDPMTLVAQGAALFAAQRGLWCGESARAPSAAVPVTSAGVAIPSDSATNVPRASGSKTLLLKAPPVSTDLLPFVVGTVLKPGTPPHIARLRLVREHGAHSPGAPWQSAWANVDADGAFAVGAELLPRQGNLFHIEACDEAGAPVEVSPPTLSILQGVTIGDPPVSRSVGVAMANGDVHVYLDKGLPLPARRTFVHRTVDAVLPGQGGAVLRIPLVQGEYHEARFCRLIGTLEIGGDDVDRVLPSGSSIEVTLELDRGGRLSARAVVPALSRTFERIASLVVPDASPEVLGQQAAGLLERLAGLRGRLDLDDQPLVQRLAEELLELERVVERATGGDVEAAQRARRAAIEVDARVSELEAREHWSELVDDAYQDASWASSWVERRGTEAERRMLQTLFDGLDKAKKNRSVRDIERQRRSLRRLGTAAYLRGDTAYIELFETYASRADEASDLKEAHKLVEKGRKLAEAGENQKLIPIVERLQQLLPFDTQTRRQAHASGVR
jgi:molecular chaperone DnaK